MIGVKHEGTPTKGMNLRSAWGFVSCCLRAAAALFGSLLMLTLPQPSARRSKRENLWSLNGTNRNARVG